MCVFVSLGFLIIGVTAKANMDSYYFFLALGSASLFGAGTALSEVTVIGFCKGFPSSYVGWFTSGTGFSGIIASGFLILLKVKGLEISKIFLVLSPCVLVYLICFKYLHGVKERHPCYSKVSTIADLEIVADQSSRKSV